VIGTAVPLDEGNRGIYRRGTNCLVSSACPATVVAKVIPSSAKTTVVGGYSFGAAARLLSYDLRVFDEGRMTFSGGEIEAVEDGKEASIFVSLGGRAEYQPAK